MSDKKDKEPKVKKLGYLETAKAFIKELQAVENTGTEEQPIYDFSKVLPLCQKTWLKVTNESNKAVMLMHAKINVFKGNCIVKDFQRLSPECNNLQFIAGGRKYRAKVISETMPFKLSTNGEWGINPTFHKI